MSLLDRIAARGEQRAADVQPMVGTWQGSAPQAYTSSGVLPDQATLGRWMQAQMDTSGGLLIAKG